MLCCGCGAPPRRGIGLSGESIPHRWAVVHGVAGEELKGRGVVMKMALYVSWILAVILLSVLFLGPGFTLYLCLITAIGVPVIFVFNPPR